MLRMPRNVVLILAVAVAMVVGLLRPPHAAHSSHPNDMSIVATADVHHHSGHLTSSYDAASTNDHRHDGPAHNDGSTHHHDSMDHSHVQASIPPSPIMLERRTRMIRAALSHSTCARSEAIGFDRPPRPTTFG